MSAVAHKSAAADLVVRCAVLTLSDTRTAATDEGGRLIRDGLIGAGHVVAQYELLPDDPARLLAALDPLLASADLDAVVTTGGTGVSSRDVTVDAIRRRLDVELPGFGELFRMLSWEQVGSAAMLSRAVGGVASAKAVFALPGSPKAVALAMERLILPELRHVVAELRR